MGAGTFSPDDWKSYTTSRSYATKSTAEIFTASGVDKDLDPKGVAFRESRDVDGKDHSTAVIVGLDVTGSMGMLLDAMARKGLPTLVTEIYDRKPVTDPQVMCMGIGDAEVDRGPLQVTQFEADIRIATQLEKIWLEQGGGGNCYEGYALAWYFAAMHTRTDCFEKRGKKGYLFTIGDEEPTPRLLKNNLNTILGGGVEKDFELSELLTMASRQWEIFHLIVEEGSHMRHQRDRTIKKWRDILGQRAILLSDHTKFAEVIVSTIQINEGADNDVVAKSWDGSTSLVVAKATRDLTATASGTDGLVTL